MIFLWSSLFQAKGYAIDLLTLFPKYELVDLYDDKASASGEKQKATICMRYLQSVVFAILKVV